MEKVEQYIKEHIKETSSPIIDWNGNIAIYQPWLTPYDARKVAEIAMEEIIDKVCSFMADNIGEYIELKHANPTTFIEIDGDRFVNDLKQAMKDETQNL